MAGEDRKYAKGQRYSSIMESDNARRLAAFNAKLAQVDQLLVADPENETFIQLRKDILEAIKLTSELLGVETPVSAAEATVETPAADADVNTRTSTPAANTAATSEETAETAKAGPVKYAIGGAVEGFFQGEWYAARIDATNEDGTCDITYFGYGNRDRTSNLRKITSTRMSPDELPSGSSCFAVYSVDNQWYRGIAMNWHPDENKCRVQFAGYGNEEDVPAYCLRPITGSAATATTDFTESTVQVTRAPTGPAGPAALPDKSKVVKGTVIVPGKDLNPAQQEKAQREQKRDRYKKKAEKRRQVEEKQEQARSSWQSFHQKSQNKLGRRTGAARPGYSPYSRPKTGASAGRSSTGSGLHRSGVRPDDDAH